MLADINLYRIIIHDEIRKYPDEGGLFAHTYLRRYSDNMLHMHIT